ncbi:asparaginase [Salinibacterium sp. SYSU T00001]|uniref:asparaginase n=1 Tax=Homoserinimonas sedimenticola TaxID=2986805 RepID=UPI002236708A|nr:asparaginase [Salinibacterium sedimenticola]MCW4385255.1 asparaginase [Salinibacterium sedimenticola]
MSDTTPARLAELAVIRRSGMIESRHLGSLLAFAADGTVALSLGAPDAPILPRSTVKPLQAMACLAAGAELSGPELAIASGSHTGEDAHTELVAGMLERAGLEQDALGCPVDRPEDEPTFERLLRQGESRSRVRMNCSGKHAAMLLACAANGWSTDDYLDPDHPLQQQVQATMAQMTGAPITHIAVDGCGAPLFGTTVRGVASAFRSLVLAEAGSTAGRVAAAMRGNPFYVGGTGHANSDLMALMPGVLAKGGAEGVIGVATRDGASVSMKIIDGNPRATTLIAVAVLEALGYDTSAAEKLRTVAVLGGGRPVGQIELGEDLRQALAGASAQA